MYIYDKGTVHWSLQVEERFWKLTITAFVQGKSALFSLMVSAEISPRTSYLSSSPFSLALLFRLDEYGG